MPSSLYVPVLIAGMLVTGSSNSLWTKWQDMQCVENCDDPDPRNHVLFEQPVWQTLQMFLGEMLCFLPIIYTYLNTRFNSKSAPAVQLPTDEDPLLPPAAQPAADAEAVIDSDINTGVEVPKASGPKPMKGWSYLLLWLPAACDLTGTTLMNVGLLYTPVSIYQMTRGALVLFVGILSVVFLKRRLWLYQWLSLVTVMAGVSLVGYSGSVIKDTVKEPSFSALPGLLNGTVGVPPVPSTEPIEEPQVTTVLIGVFFTLFAQIFTATQFVVEEKIMARYTVHPLVAVGWEGFFGAISVIILMPLLPILRPSLPAKAQPFFDLHRGLMQMLNSPAVLWSGVVVAISISLFNYFGLSVTRYVSATARSLTDTCRTLTIWIISLGLGWERLVWPISLLQVTGFGLLVYGTFVFNNLVNPPSFVKPAETAVSEEQAALLARESLDETAVLPADLGQSGYDVAPPHPGHPHGLSQTQRSGSN